MPRGTTLSKEEQVQILAYKDAGLSIRGIAKKLKRSPQVVCNYLKLKENYNIKKRSGRPSTLTRLDKCRIVSLARNTSKSASQIRTDLALSVTNRRVLQVIQQSQQLKWKKRMRKPELKAQHREARLRFARNHMNWTDEWKHVIFSDEKKFNLDGPDGCQFYWHDLRNKESQCMMSRNFGGGSVMIWAAFGWNGTTPVVWVPPKMNSNRYVQLLDENLLPWGEQIAEENWIFQQDNAAVHSARIVKEWFA